MASVTRSPGTTASLTAPNSWDSSWWDGQLAIAWSNTDKAKANDSDPATQQAVESAGFGRVLLLTNFGFGVDAGATIQGVRVEIRRCANNTNWILDENLSLTLDGGDTVEGDDKAATSTYWPSSYAVASYGGTSDLWGCTLTPAIVNSSDFGVALQVRHSHPEGTTEARVDHVQVTIVHDGEETTSATPARCLGVLG